MFSIFLHNNSLFLSVCRLLSIILYLHLFVDSNRNRFQCNVYIEQIFITRIRWYLTVFFPLVYYIYIITQYIKFLIAFVLGFPSSSFDLWLLPYILYKLSLPFLLWANTCFATTATFVCSSFVDLFSYCKGASRNFNFELHYIHKTNQILFQLQKFKY